MEDLLGQAPRLVALLPSIFFAMLAISGLIKLYLRYHDHLNIDRVDIVSLGRNAGVSIFFMAVSLLYEQVSFFAATSLLLCLLVTVQIIKLNNTISAFRQ